MTGRAGLLTSSSPDDLISQVGTLHVIAGHTTDLLAQVSAAAQSAADAAGAQAQQTLARGDLQLGDLVYFPSPVSHIGICIGDGMMVHAPTSGDVVKVSSVDMSGYAGARRLLRRRTAGAGS